MEISIHLFIIIIIIIIDIASISPHLSLQSLLIFKNNCLISCSGFYLFVSRVELLECVVVGRSPEGAYPEGA